MADSFIIGPGYAWMGDPTQANGAGMTQLAEIGTFTLDVGVSSSFATSPINGGAPDAAGIYTMPPDASAQLSFNKLGIDSLNLLVHGAEKFTQTSDEALGFGGPIELVTPDTFVFIPAFEANANSATPHNSSIAFWMPAAFISELSGFEYNAMQRNAASNNSFRATLRSARRTTDQAAQALPTKAQYIFFGKVAALNLTTAWTLPALVA